MFVDNDSRRLYSIQDLTLDEMHALRHAIDHADLPDRGTLERLKNHLKDLPEQEPVEKRWRR